MKVTVVKNLKQGLRISWQLVKLNFFAELAFPTNAVLLIFSSIINTLASLLLIEILFTQFSDIGGYSAMEVFFLYGVFRLNKPILASILHNLQDIPSNFLEGGMDHLLLKPINALILITFSGLNIYRIFSSFTGLIIIVFALANLSIDISFLSVVLAFGSVVLFFVVFYCMVLVAMSLSVWVGNTESLFWAFDIFFNLSKNPESIFQKGFRLFFVVIMPVALLSAIPVAILLNRIDYSIFVPIGISAIFWFILARFVWRKALKHYTSATGEAGLI